jgi:hypothetical protein
VSSAETLSEAAFPAAEELSELLSEQPAKHIAASDSESSAAKNLFVIIIFPFCINFCLWRQNQRLSAINLGLSGQSLKR